MRSWRGLSLSWRFNGCGLFNGVLCFQEAFLLGALFVVFPWWLVEAASSRVRICVKQLARASVVLTPPPQDNKNVEVDYQQAWRPEWSSIHAECGPFRFVNWGYAGAGEPAGWVSAVDVVE